MEKQQLPNSTAVLVLGILSILTCCCYGVPGIILAVIAIILAKKDLKLYKENPELYTGYPNLNTGRILAIIGLIMSIITFIVMFYLIVYVGEERLKDWQQNLMEKAKYQEENS